MKTILSIAAFSLIAVAKAQDQCAASAAVIPSCAAECIISAGSSVGCAQGDYACQCSSSQSAAIASAALPCVLSACGPATGLRVQGAASAVCDCVATAVPASTTSSPATTTAEASPSVTVTSTATESSIVATTSVSLPTPYLTGASPAAGVGPTGSVMGGGSAGSDTGIVPFTGGASYVEASFVGIVGALFLAVVAL
ncbi:MAG: hypothetical protein L6R38_003643 [Xanthoria sp. 2 TBL-2021]|nr:MAG: hypothetical protein L6R38_003643 [Xanthoria sp. 2 TBL-2021]